jgi:uncharacterized protein YlbG (UPF0298 family)
VHVCLLESQTVWLDGRRSVKGKLVTSMILGRRCLLPFTAMLDLRAHHETLVSEYHLMHHVPCQSNKLKFKLLYTEAQHVEQQIHTVRHISRGDITVSMQSQTDYHKHKKRLSSVVEDTEQVNIQLLRTEAQITYMLSKS